MIETQGISYVEVAGVVFGHIIFGVGITLFLDWSWIPLSKKDKSRGTSISEIKKQIFTD